jgi:two-component system cell cycle response regulator
MSQSNRPVILFVDDHVDTNRAHAEMAKALGYRAEIAQSFEEMVFVVSELYRPAIAFVDLNLKSERSGPDVVNYLLESLRYPIIPFVLTGDNRPEVRAKAIRMRAYGRLVKPVNITELEYHIHLGELILVGKLTENIDDLTQVLTKGAFRRVAEREIEWARSKVKASPHLIMLDVDDMKGLNRIAWEVGSAVLSRVAESIKKSIRPADFVGRYGGDEFVLFLPRANEVVVGQVAERLEYELNWAKVSYLGREVPFTVSYGVGSMSKEELVGDDKINLSLLMSKADQDLKLRRAKKRSIIAVP